MFFSCVYPSKRFMHSYQRAAYCDCCVIRGVIIKGFLDSHFWVYLCSPESGTDSRLLSVFKGCNSGWRLILEGGYGHWHEINNDGIKVVWERPCQYRIVVLRRKWWWIAIRAVLSLKLLVLEKVIGVSEILLKCSPDNSKIPKTIFTGCFHRLCKFLHFIFY